MKKFSNITNQKVGQEPTKKEVKINEEEAFMYRLIDLMDNYLKIQTYGPIDRYLRAGTIKIQGKEALAEAIMSALGEKSVKEATSLLESLKSKSNDWASIDEKIEEIRSSELLSEKEDLRYSKLSEIVAKFGEEGETLKEAMTKYASKIKDAERAAHKATLAQEMFEKGYLDIDQKEILVSTLTERANSLKGNG
jgi:hypothetical protein